MPARLLCNSQNDSLSFIPASSWTSSICVFTVSQIKIISLFILFPLLLVNMHTAPHRILAISILLYVSQTWVLRR